MKEYTLVRFYGLTAFIGAVLLPAANGRAGTAPPMASSDRDWVAVWAAPPAPPTGPTIRMEVIRQKVRLSLGGRALRLRLSNELGTSRVAISSVHVALPGKTAGSIEPKTDHVVTFGGQESLVMEAGMPLLSDSLALETEPLQEIVISFFVTRATGPVATHPLGMATSFISDAGPGGVSAASLEQVTPTSARFFISEVDVQRPDTQVVIAMGDSITDGYCSTPDQNHRWPDFLVERLVREQRAIAVVNSGISGNRILHDLPEPEYGPAALSRLDRDALSVPGARTIILLESINDIGMPASSGIPEQAVTALEIIAGMQQIITRAHAHGIRVIGGTLMPFAGAAYPGYYSTEGEAKRQTVNRWIRNTTDLDGVVDFDAALRDPGHPEQLMAAFDSGDHLHPNDAGYRKMAETVNLDALVSSGR